MMARGRVRARSTTTWALLAGLLALSGWTSARAETVVGEGVIQSDEKVAIKTSVLGTIRRLAVKEGDILRKGQLIAELENQVQSAMVEALVAEVRRAESAVALAEVSVETTTREYQRNSKVPDLITEKELDLSRDAMSNARALLDVRKGELLKAQKQLDEGRANLELTVVQAPFDGQVTRVYVREGDTPRPSDTTLVDFLSLEKLYVEVALPLPRLGRVVQGMRARIDVESENAAIRRRVTGTVAYVYPENDPVTRAFRVKILVPSDGGRVLPGLFARAQIDLPRSGR